MQQKDVQMFLYIFFCAAVPAIKRYGPQEAVSYNGICLRKGKLQSLLLDAAHQIAQMDGGIHEDEAPCAVCAFDDIDARIVLLDLPEVVHAEAEDVAEDGFVHRVMGGDEHRLPVVVPGDVVEGSADAAAHIFQIFPPGICTFSGWVCHR